MRKMSFGQGAGDKRSVRESRSGLNFPCDDIRHDLLQVGFDLVGNERVEIVEGRETNLARL